MNIPIPEGELNLPENYCVKNFWKILQMDDSIITNGQWVKVKE
jgi:hypothetical protein